MTPLEAFNSGLPVNDALDKFGNWRKFELEEYLPPNTAIDGLERDPQALSKAIVNLNDALWARSRRRNDVAEDFKRRLALGKLLGLGYVSPRSISDAPVAIPTDIWALAKINFEKSEIQGGSLRFENVRITRPPKNAKIIAPAKLRLISSKDIESPRPKGRPSTRAAIFAAYQKLKNAGKIDFSAPMTHAYRKIRALLIEQHGTEKGFQNEAMRLAIKDDFQETAATLKSARKL